jgi:hypothetical protein
MTTHLGALPLNLKKAVNDPVLWRRLHDEHVGLLHLWHDRTTGKYCAYAVTPWLPDTDDGAHWSPEYDDRSRVMCDGSTPQEAVLKLFDDPRRQRDAVKHKIAMLGNAFDLLAGAYRDRH